MTEHIIGARNEGKTAALLMSASAALAKARSDSDRAIIVYDEDPVPAPPLEQQKTPRNVVRALSQVPILTLMGDPVLERVAGRVTDFGEDLQKLVANLKARFNSLPYGQKGYGLAAPQISVSKAVAYIRCPEQVTKSKAVLHEFVMVNPVITQRGKWVRVMEGCLSIPKFFHTIDRRYSVTVMYKDETGTVRKQNAKGLLAQVIQHECDHLAGTLITTYVKERQGRRLAQRCVDHCLK
jgi:peptide deformylase